MESNPGKKWPMAVLGVILGLVALLAVLCFLYSRPTAMTNVIDFDAFQIDNVFIGADGEDRTDSCDTAAIAAVLSQAMGSHRLLPDETGFERTEETIEISGRDSKGPVHLVLKKDEAVFYRNGSRRTKIQNADALYETVRTLCQ